jgi:D-alanyl-lipoteichoic acid acyltransferase DltB (MBOAT superfamily)
MTTAAHPGKRKLTLGRYVKRRNGVPLGAPGSLRNMFYRALGAGSFAEFWRYWNPVFGYYLGRYIFAPLRKWLPPPVALVVTFVACGALHDAVIIAVRGSMAFLFVPWFFVMGVVVVIGEKLRIDYSELTWPVRASINTTYVGGCLVVALLARI